MSAQETLTVALSSCPFCGGYAGVATTSGSNEQCGYNFTATVSCGRCGAHLSVSSKSDKQGWCKESRDSCMARAAEAWNRRATHPSRDGEELPTMANENARLAREVERLKQWQSGALSWLRADDSPSALAMRRDAEDPTLPSQHQPAQSGGEAPNNITHTQNQESAR